MAGSQVTEVVCCSLEPWDEVWRRNQHLAAGLLELRPDLRLLFAEAAIDIPWSLVQRRWPAPSALRSIGDTGRLWGMAPRKWLPRRLWAGGDRSLFRQVTAASHKLGFDRPVLWINDSVYAPMVTATGWPSVYDITDDWLLGRLPTVRWIGSDGTTRPCCGRPPRSSCARRRSRPAAARSARSTSSRTASTSIICAPRWPARRTCPTGGSSSTRER